MYETVFEKGCQSPQVAEPERFANVDSDWRSLSAFRGSRVGAVGVDQTECPRY